MEAALEVAFVAAELVDSVLDEDAEAVLYVLDPVTEAAVLELLAKEDADEDE